MFRLKELESGLGLALVFGLALRKGRLKDRVQGRGASVPGIRLKVVQALQRPRLESNSASRFPCISATSFAFQGS